VNSKRLDPPPCRSGVVDRAKGLQHFAIMPSKVSAGLLMFRNGPTGLEVLLVHPGGPYFQKKDAGAWTIPKGEVGEGEDLLTRAQTEFEEELGIKPSGDWIELGSVKQKGGKVVHAWAFEGDLRDDFQLKSNTFQLEWPPRSGRLQTFPEIDKAAFFSVEEAKEKINVAQAVLLDRLSALLASRASRSGGFQTAAKRLGALESAPPWPPDPGNE
jgi:predicted NUDIX family NTP pyrophosphohydrolase